MTSASCLGAAALWDAVRANAAGRLKITEIRQVPLRIVRPLGSYPDFLGNPRAVNIGGGAFLEIHTDAGITGIGPDVDPGLLKVISEVLVGQDPFNINHIAARLYDLPGGNNVFDTPAKFRGSASAEIAVWDLIGKIAGQPLYKLWGGGRARVTGYASMLRLSTPEERAQEALRQKADGWKAMKLRAHFPHMRDDIRLVEEVRKAAGDEFVIMVDANKAILDEGAQKGVRWDFTRAVQTALAYEKLGVEWLEEPLERYDYDHLAELNRCISMKLAGGEGNHGIHEFRDLLERGCYDIVQPEILIEGPTHLRQVAVLAQAMDAMCMPHQGDSRLGTICDLHLVASWPERVAPYLEVFNDQPIGDYTNPFAIFENPPLLDRDGAFPVPQGPGLGVTIREDMIDRR
jgi:D-galactarolactone cycloisomerase